jgi:hypothetical protein
VNNSVGLGTLRSNERACGASAGRWSSDGLLELTQECAALRSEHEAARRRVLRGRRLPELM